MSGVFVDIIFWLELIITFALLIAAFFSFIYFSFGFVEERFYFIRKFGQALNIFLLALCILIPFTDYGMLPFLTTLAENICWYILLNRDITLVKLLSFELIGGFVFTILAHISWIIAFMNTLTDGFVALFCYLLMVWAIPLLTVIALPLMFDENGNSKISGQYKKSTSFWASLFSKLIPKVQSMIPRSASTSKLD